MKQNRQFVRVNSDFINKDLSAGAVKVLFLLASIAQAGGSDTAVISNARIAERTKLTNITRIINELYAIGAVTERIQRFKSNRQKCNAYVLYELYCLTTPFNELHPPERTPSSIVDQLLVGFQFDYTETVPKGLFYGWMYRTYGVIAPKFRRRNNKFVGGNVIPFL